MPIEPQTSKNKRNPRFRRVGRVSFRLQERDIDIIRHVYKHRFLTSEHIKALIPGSDQRILRRLQALYHSDHLDRPREQIIHYRAGAGSTSMIYGLGNKGADLLTQEFRIARAKVDWTSKNRTAQVAFLEHTLEVADFMVCLELACRQRKDIEMIEPAEILDRAPAKTRGKYNPFAFQVKAKRPGHREAGPVTFGVIPDKIFGLHFVNEPAGRNWAYFFLEADRATMPVKRKNLFKTSFYKKMLGYYTASPMKQGVFKETFGFKNARVLTVTKSQDRINSMIEVGKDVDERGKGTRMFWFTQAGNIDLGAPEKVLDKIWSNGRDQGLFSLVGL
jgi:hypothetical protein